MYNNIDLFTWKGVCFWRKLKLGDLNTIRTKYKDANDQVNRHQLEGEGGIQNDGLYYFIPSDASKNENTQLLRDNLNL